MSSSTSIQDSQIPSSLGIVPGKTFFTAASTTSEQGSTAGRSDSAPPSHPTSASEHLSPPDDASHATQGYPIRPKPIGGMQSVRTEVQFYPDGAEYHLADPADGTAIWTFNGKSVKAYQTLTYGPDGRLFEPECSIFIPNTETEYPSTKVIGTTFGFASINHYTSSFQENASMMLWGGDVKNDGSMYDGKHLHATHAVNHGFSDDVRNISIPAYKRIV